MKIESRIGKSTFSEKAIYDFISDFNNFRDLIPEDKIKDWESTSDHCSFNVQPLGRTGLKIIEKEPDKLIKIVSDPEYSKYDLTLWIQIKAVSSGDTRIKLTAEPKVNQIMLSMIKNPVRMFLDNMISKIEEFSFSQNS